MFLKKGVKLIEETPGKGELVQRQHNYVISTRISLNRGDIVRRPQQCLSHSIDENLKVHDNGFFEHRVRIDRECLIPGLFYSIDGMRVGGYRKVIISPHLAYKDKGIEGLIPPNAKIIAEIFVLRAL